MNAQTQKTIEHPLEKAILRAAEEQGIGADDYVTKPFSVKQLYARMEAVMRRTTVEHKPSAGRLSWEDDLVIDLEEASVRKKGVLLSLTKSEWRILSAMAGYPKNPVYIKTVHGLGYKFGGGEN